MPFTFFKQKGQIQAKQFGKGRSIYVFGQPLHTLQTNTMIGAVAYVVKAT